jgi:hypothetical protein
VEVWVRFKISPTSPAFSTESFAGFHHPGRDFRNLHPTSREGVQGVVLAYRDNREHTLIGEELLECDGELRVDADCCLLYLADFCLLYLDLDMYPYIWI